MPSIIKHTKGLEFQRLKTYLLGERYQNSEKAYLFINACLTITAFSILFYVISIVIEFKAGQNILLTNIFLYSILLFLLRSKIPLFYLAQTVIVLGSLTVITLIIFDGGLYSNVIPWLAALPTASLLITNKKTSQVWLLIMLVLILIFAILDAQGVKFPRTHNKDWYTITQSIILMGLVLVIYIFNLIFEKARNRANLFLNEKNKELELQRLETLRQAEELKKLNQLKTQLLSAISHDFRSPLVSIKSVLSVLDEKLISPEDFGAIQKELTHRLDITLNSMDNLLQWSKSQVGQDFKVNVTDFAIRKAIERSTQLLKDMMNHKKIKVVHVIHTEPHVSADFEQIQIVLRNLISNAIKFSHEGGVISIYATEDGENVRIRVKDEGIGMDESQLSDLFIIGKHQSTFGTKNEKGTGLGLLLIKDYIEKNKGVFTLKSEKGKGSEFMFTLPLSDAS